MCRQEMIPQKKTLNAKVGLVDHIQPIRLFFILFLHKGFSSGIGLPIYFGEKW